MLPTPRDVQQKLPTIAANVTPLSSIKAVYANIIAYTSLS